MQVAEQLEHRGRWVEGGEGQQLLRCVLCNPTPLVSQGRQLAQVILENVDVNMQCGLHSRHTFHLHTMQFHHPKFSSSL